MQNVWTSGKQLSFINKDQSNIAIRNKEDGWQIRSHATVHSRPSKSSQPSPPSVAASKQLIKPRPSSRPGNKPQIIAWRLGAPPRSGAARIKSTKPDDQQEQRLRVREGLASYRSDPLSLLQRGNSDPFSAAAIEITPSVNDLVRVWKGVFLETVWPREAPSPPSVWGVEGQQIISSKIRLNALLVWVTSLVRAAVSDRDTQHALEIQSLR